MDFKTLLSLPLDCRCTLTDYSKDNLKDLFQYFFVGKDAIIKHNLDTVEEFKLLRTPVKVWTDKKGHCFELSLFWLACLKYLKINSKYCEKFPWFYKGSIWDHAFVKVELGGKFILNDPGREIFKAKFRKYRELNRRQTIGDYYTNCALMLNPYDTCQRMVKLSEIKKKELAKETIRYARLGLKYDPGQIRARDWLKDIQNQGCTPIF